MTRLVAAVGQLLVVKDEITHTRTYSASSEKILMLLVISKQIMLHFDINPSFVSELVVPRSHSVL